LSNLAVQMKPQDPSLSEALSLRNFNRLAKFIHDYSGIRMPPNKRTMLEGRLRRCMRDSGYLTVDDYCDYLFDGGGLDREELRLIDAITTNKTDFFREPQHFDFLREEGLQALTKGGRARLKIWSAACSIGAEAYTMAMVLEEFSRQVRRVDYSILGTDLCTQVLTQAMAGRYPEAMIEPVPQELRARYVMRSRDPRRPEVRIAPELRGKLSVARLNLIDDAYPVDRDFDVIFLRNILIYFDKPTQAKVLNNLCDHLRPGGYLILGHSESIVGVDLPVTPVAHTVFQRR
jgi:chemotaxis protein methyltransferase CheR